MIAATMSDRIGDCLGGLRRRGRKGLIVYLTAGDPDLAVTPALLHALVAGGADIIELGFPHHAPALDGPVIRAANTRAIAAGSDVAATLAVLRRFRQADMTTPVVLMGYAAPIVAMGTTGFAAAAATAGADGVLVPDLALRLAGETLLPALAAEGLLAIPLMAPARGAADVFGAAGQGGFVYCVPVAGPTGGPPPPLGIVAEQVARCRALTDLPVAVGFGIDTPATAAAIAGVADAVVVATVIVAAVQAWFAAGEPADAVCRRLTALVAEFRRAIDAGRSSDAQDADAAGEEDQPQRRQRPGDRDII